MPKISVITVAYNSQDTIEKTLKSVVNQTYKDFEYIFVDGNSKDKTLEIVSNYKDFVKKWISEPCKSKFDAMNKGVLLAQGEYILFLNSDSVFYDDNVLEKFSKLLDGTDIVYGNAQICNLNTNTVSVKKIKTPRKLNLYKGELLLPTEFIKTNMLEILGGFDTRFKFEADCELNIRAIFENKASIKYVDEIVSTINSDNSDRLIPKRIRRSVKEKMVIKKYYFSKLEKLFYSFI